MIAGHSNEMHQIKGGSIMGRKVQQMADDVSNLWETNMAVYKQ
jgi:hypothetical protein